MSKQTKLLIGAAAFLLVGAAVWIFTNFGFGTPTKTFAADETVVGNLVVAQGTRVVVKNGAKLTVEGDFLVQGSLQCEDGPIQLLVKGTFLVERLVQCDLENGEKAGGNGIMIAAQAFDIKKEAVIVTNGHVQLVTDESKLARDQATLDALYQSTGTYEGGQLHVGPFTPLEQIPANTPGRPTTTFRAPKPTLAHAPSPAPREQGFFIPKAHAQRAATDASGNPVPGAVKIGGKWIIGTPVQAPPFNLEIPTPPADIKKIIVNFDFGGEDMLIQDFELTGPDGRKGTDDTNTCNAQGSRGEDAMRLNVRAASITINNFTLHLGSGGEGGAAKTKTDCEAGVARGGEGGSAGNFKIVAPEGFAITGAFDIFPGKGGAGGKAEAFGKKGEDGCDGTKGGDATATGGKGADNNKLLVASGTIGGKENIVLHDMVGGKGGDGEATGGNGGNGTGSKCNGGDGGKATATGGAGGNTACARFPCIGGDGGNASAKPGTGGKGGAGSSTQPGGNGGKGGDAVAQAGKGGVGKTANGTDGVIQAQTGGNGGNGGDGCGEGKGGGGGDGNPAGTPGTDGKNLCPPGSQPPTSATPTEPQFAISQDLSFTHKIGTSPCPQQVGKISITGTNITDGTTVRVSGLPPWLAQSASGLTSNVQFTCNIETFETQTLTTPLKVMVLDKNQKTLHEFTVKVTGNIQK